MRSPTNSSPCSFLSASACSRAWLYSCPFHKLELYEIGELPVLPPLSVGEMALRLYGALN